MGQTSSVNTLAATTGMSTVIAMVEWFANSKLGLAMPPEVVVGFAAIIVPIAHFLVNVVNTLWSGWVAANEPAAIGAAPTIVTHESGFARLSMLFSLVLIAVLCMGLSGCGTVNTWMAAKTNVAEQDYEGAKKQKQHDDDDALHLWTDTSCAITVGALSRNPDALTPVMAACPVSGMAKVSTSNGNVSLVVPNSVPLVQQSGAASTAPQATSTATSMQTASSGATQQTMDAILLALQAIQAQTASTSATASTTKTPTKAAAAPTALRAPAATLPAPVQATTPPAAAPSSAAPVAPSTQIKSFLSAPRTGQ